MKNTQQEREEIVDFYTDSTDPLHGRISAPLVLSQRLSFSPRTNWFTTFLTIIWRKINQLLLLSLSILVLLLFIRFLIEGFRLTSSLFVQWTMLLSSPFIYPFRGMFPVLPYHGFFIDASTLVAIVAYILATTLLRQLLKTLLTNW